MIPEKSSMNDLGQGVYTDGDIVYKFGNDYRGRPLDGEAQALKNVLGIPNTQEFVGYDSKKNILITKFVSGYHFDEKSDEFKTGIVSYSDEQLEQLFDTLVQMKHRGVAFDTYLGNLLYDDKKGFTPIDYSLSTNPDIEFRLIYNILSLERFIIGTEYNHEILPDKIVSGKNQDKHADTLVRMIRALRKVDSKEADVVIGIYRNQQMVCAQLSKFQQNTWEQLIQECRL